MSEEKIVSDDEKRKTAFIKVKYKYKVGRKNLWEYRVYEYDPDESWEKWGKLLLNPDSFFDKVQWYKDNVIVSEIHGFNETVQLVRFLESKFGVTNKKMKAYLKLCGKVGRGINVPGFSKKSIEYVVLKGMNGSITYSDFSSISFKDMLYFKRMLDQEVMNTKDIIKKNKKGV